MLSDTKLRTLKQGDKPYKLADSDGLYIYVTATGGRSWRFDYRFEGKRYTQTFGKYPDISLADARSRLREARSLLASGKNPQQEKRNEKILRREISTNTFSAIADEWYSNKKALRSKAWKEANELYLKRDLNPRVGSLPISEISGQLLLAAIKEVSESRGVRTAERARQTAGQVFDYAIRQFKTTTNPSRLITRWAEIPPAEHRRPLTPKEIPDFVSEVIRYSGMPSTKNSVLLILYTFVRKSEATNATWDEFDFENALWTIPKERMKMAKAHIVPLSQQALAILNRAKLLAGDSKFVFPSNSTTEKPMSGATINSMFKKMGYGGSFTPHGLRSTASTILNELGFGRDPIERQLAHNERDDVRAAYNHADYLPERKKMMQSWADYLEKICGISSPSARENFSLENYS